MGQQLTNTYPQSHKSSQEAPFSPAILQNPLGTNQDSTFEHTSFKLPEIPVLKNKSSSIQTLSADGDDEQTFMVQSSIYQEELRLSGYESQDEVLLKKDSHISFDSFRLIHKIGSGSWGQVFLAEEIQHDSSKNQPRYALKQMKKNKLFEHNLIDNIKMEKRIMQNIDSKFITQLYHTFQDEWYCYLTMEQAQGGDVYSLIEPRTKRQAMFKKGGQNAIRFILGCAVLGLQALHQKRIAYCDLKPQNLLIFEDGYVKLTDFGLSKQLDPQHKYYMKVGTQDYFAPQLVLGSQCTTHIDLWALGIVAYELSNYEYPFKSEDIMIPQIFVGKVIKEEKNRTWASNKISKQLKSFINSLLKLDPKLRIGYKSYDQIKGHPFFKMDGFSWDKLSQKKLVSPLLSIISKQKVKYGKVKFDEIRPLFSSFEAPKREHHIEGWADPSPSFN